MEIPLLLGARVRYLPLQLWWLVRRNQARAAAIGLLVAVAVILVLSNLQPGPQDCVWKLVHTTGSRVVMRRVCQ